MTEILHTNKKVIKTVKKYFKARRITRFAIAELAALSGISLLDIYMILIDNDMGEPEELQKAMNELNVFYNSD